MKETRLAYVAGLIDADGSLYISKSTNDLGYVSYDPTVMIRTTHFETVKWLVSTFGGTFNKTDWVVPIWKRYYRWKFTSDKHASRFLDKILSYLWLKKEQAFILKEYFEMNGVQNKEKREALYQRVSKLNQNLSVTTNTSNLSLKRNLHQAYLAGMFDGEGSSYIIRVKQSKASGGNGFYYRACVSLGCTFEPVIVDLFNTYGGFTRKRPPHNGILPMYEWDIKDNKGKEKFLLSILPYLITKRKQSKIVLDFVRLCGTPDPEKRKRMWFTCSELNGKKRESDLTGDCKRASVVTQIV